MEQQHSTTEKPNGKDSLGRRKRHHGRQPTGKTIVASKADIIGIFAPLQRHGLLPTHYLVEFSKHLAVFDEELKGKQNLIKFRQRLTSLYNDGAYVDRPSGQFPPGDVQLQSIVYALDRAGYHALKSKRHLYANRADAGWYEHQLMTACITASIELATLKHGTIYGSQEEIFRHEKCPPATLEMERPVELQLGTRTEYDKKTGKAKDVTTTIIPDQLFRIKYPESDKTKIFVLEADRATEDLETVYEKLRRWVYVLKHDIHQKQWGTPSLIVMVYTTDEYRMRRFMEKLKTLTDDTDPFLFKFDPQFERDWHVPPVLYDVYNTPFFRADGSIFDITY